MKTFSLAILWESTGELSLQDMRYYKWFAEMIHLVVVSYESALDMHDMEDSSQGSELHGIMESCKTLDQKLFLKRALFILILSTKALHYITLN